MLGYFYLCVTFSGLRKSYGLNCFFFFRPELSVNIARELSFEWAQQKNFIRRLKMGIISFKQSMYNARSSLQRKYEHKLSMVHPSDTNINTKHENKRLMR